MTTTLLVEAGLDPAEIFWAVFLFGLPVLAGRALRSRALLQAELHDKAERAERERACSPPSTSTSTSTTHCAPAPAASS
jgi:hypothetical protein